jgi:peptide-N4-(N-acetyl-beta-glucosaminyl)asparagine amidase
MRTQILRASLTDIERLEAVERESRHQAWLEDDERRACEAQVQELGGRESGPEEWREARQEMGTELLDIPHTGK